MEEHSSPSTEARGLLHLLATREEDPASIRRMLRAANDPFHKETELHFDALLLRVSIPQLRRGKVVLLRRSNAKLKPTPTLEAEILRRMRAGDSTVRAAKTLKVPISAVARVSKVHQLAYEKIGPGRRFRAEFLEQLAAELQAGSTPAELRRRHRISAQTILKVRRSLLNDYSDRRALLRTYNPELVRAALATDKAITRIETEYGISNGSLWKLRRRLGDREDRRARNRKTFSEEEKAVIIADLHRGLSQRAASKKYHVHTGRVRQVQAEAGLLRTIRHFTPAEVLKVEKAIRRGETNGEIARRFGSTPGAIWQRRNKMGASHDRRISGSREPIQTGAKNAGRFRPGTLPAQLYRAGLPECARQ